DTAALTATVANDSSNAGVTWTAPAIGSLSSLTVLAPTYTAPAATASAQTVTLTATSVADSTKSSSVTLTIPVAPTITTTSLPSFTAGIAYSTTLAGAGGIGPYTWKLIGGSWPLGLSLNATTGEITAAAGATTTTPATNLTFQMTDSGLPTALTATATLSLTINPSPSAPVTGSVVFNNLMLSNGCNSLAGPAVTLSINTTPTAQTATTNSNGSFSFASVPYGTYTITPSIPGTNAIFTPASQSITVSNGGTQINFNALVNYSISGTVSYSGNATGPIYLALQDSCTINSATETVFTGLGTGIIAPGPFTIHGVAPGTYTVYAWRDSLNSGQINASDPTGSASAGTISTANLPGVSVALTDPAPVAFSSSDSISTLGVVPFESGAMITGFEMLGQTSQTNQFMLSYEEKPTSYTVQWSTDSTFATIDGSKSYPASGTYEATWILSGLTDGQILYFRYQGVAGSASSAWSGVTGPVTIGAPSGTVTASGNVSFNNAATGPLYISFENLSTDQTYYTAIANPVSPQPYSIQLPADGNYYFYAFIDQNNDNVLDDGDMYPFGPVNQLAITGSSATQDISLVGGGNSYVWWNTYNNQTVGSSSNNAQEYRLGEYISNGSKQIISAEGTSGPGLVTAKDTARCLGGGVYAYCSALNLYGNAPNVGDSYSVLLTYLDGSQETVTGKINGAIGNFGANPSPAGVGTDLTPNFSWTDPSNGANDNYYFQLSMSQGPYSSPPEGWRIPGYNSDSTTFSSSIDSITWGVDPTGGGSAPTQPSLTSKDSYAWQVMAIDSNANQSFLTVYYYPGYTGVNIPATNPSTLGAATVGQDYTGTITASGGTSPYTFTVTGLSDGLSYSSNGGTLIISGTPVVAGAITFQVTAQDSTSASWGPVTYTIYIGN
ncbi:MAG TPA: putative Ig domain-containing protein, partial [Terracidiphilus sp.]